MSNTKTIYVAGGCFWGLEELFRKQPGVVDTEVGYMGGQNENPNYTFHPGHAEAVAIEYNPEETDEKTLLEYFFRIHDPTTIDRQGNDMGSSYRSAIFYQNDDEKKLAEAVIDAVNASGNWAEAVVTTLEEFDAFWPAEAEHQDYLQRYPGGYTCHFERRF